MGHFGSCHDGLQAHSFVLKIHCKQSKLYSLRAEIKQNLGTRGGGAYIYIYICFTSLKQKSPICPGELCMPSQESFGPRRVGLWPCKKWIAGCRRFLLRTKLQAQQSDSPKPTFQGIFLVHRLGRQIESGALPGRCSGRRTQPGKRPPDTSEADGGASLTARQGLGWFLLAPDVCGG